MVSLLDLWLPIVLSAAAVWVASALAWMVMPHHKNDFKKLADEDTVMKAVRAASVAPGIYFFPHMTECNPAKMDPETKAKFESGPHGLLQVWPPESFGKMGRNMVLSFIFYLVVGVFIAYLATIGLSAGRDFMGVFRFTGTAALMAYTFASIPQAIWFGTPLRNVLACIADGVAFAVITGALFAWLWPAITVPGL
ncbi:MAG TPA: hypothetical protein PK400_02895 [Phycisphaerales bacterium]|nr:hypothetical protein [Phycisphaerales bacterium]HRQ74596.1 hypothetical protein [Phycisphaerales bacterium]